MKINRPLLLGAFLVGITALLAGCATQPRPEPMAIVVLRIKGEARVSIDGKTWQPLKRGDVLKNGALVLTASKSLVDISLGEMPHEPPAFNSTAPVYAPVGPKFKPVRIFENSTLKIGKAVKFTHARWNHWSGENLEEVVRLDLNSGSILGLARSVSENPIYEVGFTNGVVTFSRDTLYIIEASGKVEVSKGTASIFLADKNSTLTVTSRLQYDPASGNITEIPAAEILRFPFLGGFSGESQPEAIIQPLSLGHGPGMGGALRKF